MTAPESEAERRQSDADPLIIGLTQHALETGDIERLADLIEDSSSADDRAMRDAFIMGLARSEAELTPDEYRAEAEMSTGQLRVRIRAYDREKPDIHHYCQFRC